MKTKNNYERSTFKKDEEQAKQVNEALEATAATAELVGKLNVLLSNLQVQYFNIHAIHWNIKSHDFIVLHKYMDEIYDATATHIDVVAEFVRILDATPMFTMSEYLRTATIPEIDFIASEKRHLAIEKLIVDNGTILRLANELFAATPANADINDYMATIVSDHGKRNWFLNSAKNENE